LKRICEREKIAEDCFSHAARSPDEHELSLW
jgi:hypothetical protein